MRAGVQSRPRRRRGAYGLLMFDIGAMELLVLAALVAVVVWLLMRRRSR